MESDLNKPLNFDMYLHSATGINITSSCKHFFLKEKHAKIIRAINFCLTNEKSEYPNNVLATIQNTLITA